MSNEKDSKPMVYVPEGARINTENFSDVSPTTKYERRRVALDRNRVKKVVGGHYGKKDE